MNEERRGGRRGRGRGGTGVREERKGRVTEGRDGRERGSKGCKHKSEKCIPTNFIKIVFWLFLHDPYFYLSIVHHIQTYSTLFLVIYNYNFGTFCSIDPANFAVTKHIRFHLRKA